MLDDWRIGTVLIPDEWQAQGEDDDASVPPMDVARDHRPWRGSNVSTTTLASLALLKANVETEGRDVLDMVAPLVEFVGSKAGLIAGFSPAVLKEATLKELGLVLPERAIDLILRRMQRRGLATRDSGLCSVTGWPVDAGAIDDDRAELLRRSSDIVEHLRSFVAERYKLSWSSDRKRPANRTW